MVSSLASGASSASAGGGLSRAWCFIVETDYSNFFPTAMPRELAELMTYGCGQLEGTEIDGYRFVAYTEFANQQRIAAVREWISAKPEHGPSGGSDDQDESPARIWCRNFSSRPVYLKDRKTHIARHTDASFRAIAEGELIARAAWAHGSDKRSGAGERTDMEDIREILREHGPQEGIRLVAEKYPGQFMRYPSGITQLADLVVPKVAESDAFVLRPWQECLVEILRKPAHDRHIYWIEDAVGGEGKSRLSTYLCRTMNAIELDGRMTDCAFAYASQPIVIFDLARPVDVLQLKDLYTMAEKLKNGQVVSSKYQSKLKVFKVPHVVFFSNHAPPMGVWSADRVQHIVLTPSPPFQPRSVMGSAPPPRPPQPSGADLFKKLMAEKKRAAEAAAEEQAEADEVIEDRAAGKKRLHQGIADRKEQHKAARRSESESVSGYSEEA